MEALSVLSPQAISLLKRHGLLQQLAVSQVLYEVASEIALSEQEWKDIKVGLRRQAGIEETENLESALTERGIDVDIALEQASRPIRLSKYGMKKFGHKVEQHFLTRKHNLDSVVYSLIRVKDADLARELYFQLSTGEGDFAQLAEKYSEGPERSTRGIVGPVPLSQAHPLLSEHLRTSKIGEIRPPVSVETWWLIVRLENEKAASLDAATESGLAQELLNAWARGEAASRIERLETDSGRVAA